MLRGGELGGVCELWKIPRLSVQLLLLVTRGEDWDWLEGFLSLRNNNGGICGGVIFRGDVRGDIGVELEADPTARPMSFLEVVDRDRWRVGVELPDGEFCTGLGIESEELGFREASGSVGIT